MTEFGFAEKFEIFGGVVSIVVVVVLVVVVVVVVLVVVVVVDVVLNCGRSTCRCSC